jgi:hypothetical protein
MPVPKGRSTVWKAPGPKVWASLSRIRKEDLVRDGWLVEQDDGSLLASTRLKRAALSDLAHLQDERMLSYSIPGYVPPTDGTYLALWFDTHGCVRIETLSHVSSSDRQTLRQDLATEAGCALEELRYDIATVIDGCIVPHEGWSVGNDCQGCPATWRKLSAERTVWHYRSVMSIRRSFDRLLDLLEATEMPGPLPGHIVPGGDPALRNSPDPQVMDEIRATSSGLEQQGHDSEPRDLTRRMRMICTEISDVINTRGSAIVVVGKDRYDVNAIQDIDMSSGLIVVGTKPPLHRPAYWSPQPPSRIMIDISQITSVALAA